MGGVRHTAGALVPPNFFVAQLRPSLSVRWPMYEETGWNAIPDQAESVLYSNILHDSECVHDALIAITFVKSVKRSPGPKVL